MGWKPVNRVLLPGLSYADRNATLRQIGYEDYSAYLGSKAWKEIKERASAMHGDACALCGWKDVDFHHLRYHHEDLTGKMLKYIRPLCPACHEDVEFDNGRKRSVQEALDIFNHLLRLHS